MCLRAVLGSGTDSGAKYFPKPSATTARGVATLTAGSFGSEGDAWVAAGGGIELALVAVGLAVRATDGSEVERTDGGTLTWQRGR